MKQLTLLLVGLLPASLGAYTYHRSITVDHTQCGASDSYDFPVLVMVADPTLKTVANGGHVTNSSGYDIAFYSDSNGTLPLSWELLPYDGASGTVWAWVRIPLLSHTADTAIYMYYGDAKITAFQSTANTVWNSTYSAVWHLSDGTPIDAAANANTGAMNGTNATTGPIDGATAFSGNGQMTVPNSSSIDVGAGPFTISTWFFIDAFNGPYTTLFEKTIGSQIQRDYAFFVNDAGSGFWSFGNGAFGITGTSWWDSAVWTPATWHYLVVTRGNGGAVTAYLDGSLRFSDSSAYTQPDSGGALVVGNSPSKSGSPLAGKLDDFRISNAARPADWILAEYNNQRSPGTFLTIGNEVTSTPIALTGGSGSLIID